MCVCERGTERRKAFKQHARGLDVGGCAKAAPAKRRRKRPQSKASYTQTKRTCSYY